MQNGRRICLAQRTRGRERVGVSEASILRAARRGQLKGYKVGAGRKLWRFRDADLDEWAMASTPQLVQPRKRSA